MARERKQPQAKSAESTLPGRRAAANLPGPQLGILYGAFAVALGYGMLVPLVPSYLRAGTQAADVALHTGALAAAFMISASLAAPLWGLLSDRFGRLVIALAGLVGASLAPVPFMLSHGAPQLYLFQVLAGVFFGAVAPAAAALMFEDGDAAGRGLRLATLGAATLGGYLAGPVLGGWLAGMAESARDSIPAHDVVRIALAMHASIVALAVPAVWLRARRHVAASGAPARAPGDAENVRDAALALCAVMLAAFALGGFEIGTSLHMRGQLDLGSRAVAAVFVVCGLAMMAAQLGVLPRLALRSDRMGWALALIVGVAGLLGAMRFAGSLSFALALAALIGGGLGLAMALLSLQTAALGGRRRGLALGLQISVANAGQAIGSVSAGASFAVLDRWALPTLALVVAPLALILLFSERRVSRRD